jgi:regulator of RNase E activity RraA
MMATRGDTRPDLVTRLRRLPTAAISDALDRTGIEGALPGLAPLSDGFRAAGPAFTVRYARSAAPAEARSVTSSTTSRRVRSSTTTAALTSRCGAAS